MTTNLIAEAKTKKVLLRNLLDGIKGCQTRFGSRTELATEDDSSIRKLCTAFEEVFLHGGIRKPNAQPAKGLWQMTENLVPAGLRNSTEYFSFWPLVKLQLSKHEAERFLLLHNVRSNLGRGRAWIRASLNEHSLERYILIVLSFEQLNLFYEDWAFLRDHELSSILPQAAAGLGSVLFALRVDNPDLDILECGMDKSIDDPIAESGPELVEIADVALCSSVLSPDSTGKHIAKKHKKKKKTPTAFVSFDDEELSGPASQYGGLSAASSVPSTCLNSPIEKEFNPSSELASNEAKSIVKSPMQSAATIPTSSETKNQAAASTSASILPTSAISIILGNTDSEYRIPDRVLKSNKTETMCSSSLKSVDCLSIYSDCSDRIDNISLSGMSPNQRLKPVGSDLTQGESDPERTHDLIPVPSYTNTNYSNNNEYDNDEDELIDNEDETNDSFDGMVFSTHTLKEMNLNVQESGCAESVSNKIFNLSPKNSIASFADAAVGERLTKLKVILDHEVELVTSLKVQIADDKRHNNDEIKILEARIEATSKENGILKHQLKKYIGAVQMLKEVRRRASFEDIDDDQPTQSGSGITDDELTTEGVEYERKLIQVAEMHGELMEFNCYLQGELKRKEHVIKLLREELVDLRGPFAGPVMGNYDDLVDTENISPELTREGQQSLENVTHRMTMYNERVLINIWIPSVFLTGATNDLHHVYQVFVRIKDTEWNVYRRYSQFHTLHRDLKKRDSVTSSFYFPPKKHLGNKDTKFVDERRRKLQEYLRKLMNHTLQTNSILASHPDKNLLISILPFFGEVLPALKPNRDRSRSRGIFFRQSGSSPTPRSEGNSRTGWVPADSSSGQYTGL